MLPLLNHIYFGGRALKNIKMTKIVAGSMASLMLLLAAGTPQNAEADTNNQAASQQTQQNDQ